MKPAERSRTEGALFTDQYQLSMAQLYFDEGLHDRTSQFDYTFRSYPDYGRHQAGYCVLSGLEWLLDWMQAVRFAAPDIDTLRDSRTAVGGPLFGSAFLGWLEAHGNFGDITMDAIPEGRVVHAYAPLITVTGPLAVERLLNSVVALTRAGVVVAP